MGKKVRDKYAIGQHELICEHFGVSESPAAPGDTAFEAVVRLQEAHAKQQQEIERLRAALKQYADKDNWAPHLEYPCRVIWMPDSNGYEVAKKVL